MKRLSVFTVLFLLAPIAEGAETIALDQIYEVDYRFFLQNPRLPWEHDLFRKQAGIVNAPANEPKHTLQGIARSGRRVSAVIDNQVVNVGDKVGDRRVAEIGGNYVLLEKNSSLVELTLNPNAENTPPAAPKDTP